MKYQDPNEVPVGKSLAEKVAKRLRARCDLMFYHREYCGMGLTYYNRTFQYGRVWDGFFNEPILEFQEEKEFIEWLSVQTNKSLQGLDEKDKFYRSNQRINLERLQEFVKGRPQPRVE